MKKLLLSAAALLIFCGNFAVAQSTGAPQSIRVEIPEYDNPMILTDSGNGHYTNTFEIAPSWLNLYIRLYSDDSSDTFIGQADSEKHFIWSNEPAVISCVETGRYPVEIGTWTGGEMHFDFNWADKTLVLTSPTQPVNNPSELYLVGSFNNWLTPDLADPEYILCYDNATDTYKGEFYIPENQMSFKIFSEKSGWSDFHSYFGTLVGQFGTLIWRDTDEMFPLCYGDGAGNIGCWNWVGGKALISVDWKKQTLTISGPDQPEMPEKPVSVEFLDGGEYAADAIKDTDYSYVGVFKNPKPDFAYTVRANYSDGTSTVYGLESRQPLELYNGDINNLKIVEKGNSDPAPISCSNWIGTELSIVVDFLFGNVIVSSVGQPYFKDVDEIYLIGNINGWNINDGTYRLSRVADRLYEGSFYFAPGEQAFRFYTSLGNWEEGYVGYDFEDRPFDIDIDPQYFSSCVKGKGSWRLADWQGGYITMSVDLGHMNVCFYSSGSGVDAVAVDDAISVRISADAAVATDAAARLIVVDAAGRMVASGTGSVALSGLNPGVYFVRAVSDAGQCTARFARH